MKIIELTQGKVALLDNKDYSRLSQYKWCAVKFGRLFYAQRHTYGRGGKKILMHREITNALTGQLVDHKNRNSLDNRRKNLRIATSSQNQCNRGLQKNNSSGFKGVYWHVKSKKWNPKITIGNKSRSLGLFSEKKDAAKPYDKAVKELHGKFAFINLSTFKPGHL